MIILNSTSSKSGHYSPAIVSQGMLYISGQLPIDKMTGKIVSGGINEQMSIVLKNLEHILKTAGASKNNVVQCRLYIPDINYWNQVDELYAEFFGDHKPVRTVIPTRELHYGALIEIEAMAELESL